MQQATTVNISFPKNLLKHIDEAAQEESRTRSELLREATRMYLERKGRWKKILSFWRTEAKSRGLAPADVEEAVRRARNLKK